ncbi:hypothetical protein P7C73_g2490, partial [Tremellales sp. Uapishka_1]
MNLAASDPIERTVRRAGSESVETPATLETDTTVAELAADQILADLEAVKTNTSSRPYSSFSNGEKWFIVSPISSNIYVPAIPLLAEKFDTTNEKINLTVTVYLIFQALTPAIWGSAADSFGRRPIYIVTMLVYVLSCVGSALCPTADYWLLMLMRILQATGGSALIAVGTGVVSDVAMPSERGKYLGLFNATSTFGPASHVGYFVVRRLHCCANAPPRLFLATSIGIGWSLQERVHIAVPVVLMFFNGLGLGFLTTATVYGIDLFPGQGGAVTATTQFNLVRCIMGAVAVAVIQMINKVMGAGWTFVLISGICALGTPLPLIVLRYGPGWRLKRGQRIAKRVEEKKQKALV